ncbi:hypothetical protein [Streptomyces atroolivaceus]|uniref:hypothetical protein n=1 Tax=Streptomyces atroolivaceus TaxID=66869 RepID=UPI0036A5F9AB
MTSPTTPSPTSASRSHTWVLWLMVMVLFSAVVALVAIMLNVRSGAGLADATLSGGTAFGATMVGCLTAVAAIKELRRLR